MILISHDLGVIAEMCARVLVMYAGEVVEEGRPADLLTDPRHPYTWALLHAAPRLDEAGGPDRRLTTIEGQPPDPRAWPDGCRFRARCPFAIENCAEHPTAGGGATGPTFALLGDAGGRRAASPAAPTSLRSSPKETAGRAPLLESAGLVQHFPLPREAFFARQRVSAGAWTASISMCAPARPWVLSASPAAASRRWPGWSCA